MQPDIHIVVLNWNGLDDTRDCLVSIRNTGYPALKVWVVDNASENDEGTIIQNEFPEVGVLKQTENIGFCGGCNVGMKKALEENADYIMLLNNDALLTPGIFEKLIDSYKTLKSPGAISPAILHYPETQKVWFSEAKWEIRWKSGEAEFRLSYNENYEDVKNKQPYQTEFACGCCLFVSTNVIKEVGLFDERYFAFYDEAEWCARMKRKGYPSYLIPGAFMYHKVGGSTPNLVMTYLLSRNRLLWIYDNLSLGKKIKSAPVLFKELAWHWVNVLGLFSAKKQQVSKNRSRAFLRGWKDFLLRRFGKWNNSTAKIIFDKP